LEIDGKIDLNTIQNYFIEVQKMNDKKLLLNKLNILQNDKNVIKFSQNDTEIQNKTENNEIRHLTENTELSNDK